MTNPIAERLFAGLPEEVEKLRPYIAEIGAFNRRNPCCAEFAETGTSHTEACCERSETEAAA